MFEPTPHLVKELKDAGVKYTGFDIFDVRWDNDKTDPETGETIHGRDCLCIYERHRNGREVIRKELREEPRDPHRKVFVDVEIPDELREHADEEDLQMEVALPEDHPDYERDVVGIPRQIHSGDVKEVIEHIYGASRRADEWRQRLERSRQAAEEYRNKFREDYVNETAKELTKAMQAERSGGNFTVDFGARTTTTEEIGGIKINDSRRVK